MAREAVGLITLICMLVIDRPVDGSTLSRTRTHAAYALAYDLQFEACYEMLAAAVATDPRDPAPQRAIAAVTWIEILFAQGVATFEAFTGEISKGDVSRPDAPQALRDRFVRAIGEAKALADQQLAGTDDADGQYQVGATAALSALYRATVEGRTLAAFNEGRRAVSAMERARAHDRGRRETALVLGMSQYTVSTMSWPVRTLARLSGLAGDREAGLALLQEAATPGAETETDALLLLMLVDTREGRPADAMQRLASLQRAHPRNRLLPLNHGAAALAAGRAPRSGGCAVTRHCGPEVGRQARRARRAGAVVRASRHRASPPGPQHGSRRLICSGAWHRRRGTGSAAGFMHSSAIWP